MKTATAIKILKRPSLDFLTNQHFQKQNKLDKREI